MSQYVVIQVEMMREKIKMKKRLVTLLLGFAMIFVKLPATASAATCPFDRPEGFTEVWGTISHTYTLGEEFRAKEVGLNIYPANGGPQWYGDHLEFWANGNPIQDGYKFQEVGQKKMLVKRYDKQASYELQVVPKLNGKLQSCAVITPPSKISYRQSAEPFNPKDIVVRCTFTNGTTQDLGYQDLEFYAGARGMDNYKYGNAIKDGYRFTEAGEKDLIIRVVNQEMRIPFTVTPFAAKEVSRVEVTQAPEALNYSVGEGFRANEYTARYFYTDGTVEDFPGSLLNITANGTAISEGYRFQVAGEKKVVVRIGDFKTDFIMDVSK